MKAFGISMLMKGAAPPGRPLDIRFLIGSLDPQTMNTGAVALQRYQGFRRFCPGELYRYVQNRLTWYEVPRADHNL